MRAGKPVIFAHTAHARHTTAFPGDTGTCPTCGQPVIAKCGPIVNWHWAHIRGEDCDTWSEPMSEWHLSWQAHAPAERREVVIGNHRADIVGPDGSVIEVQRCSISSEDIADREAHYGLMMWIFDAREAYEDDRLNIRVKHDPSKPGYATFRWKHPRKSLAACRSRVFLDLGDGRLLRLGRIYTGAPCGGWGHLVPASQLGNWIAGAQ